MTKRVAILQSNYIPWKGYFDLIGMVDEFILFDDAQYTRNDWRNRNRIKTAKGPVWLTIPVQISGKFSQSIRETKVVNSRWTTKHWKSIVSNYSRAQFFPFYADIFKELYDRMSHENFLSIINRHFLQALCDIMQIKTPITSASDYQLIGGKTERLISLCQQVGATGTYLGRRQSPIWKRSRLRRLVLSCCSWTTVIILSIGSYIPLSIMPSRLWTSYLMRGRMRLCT